MRRKAAARWRHGLVAALAAALFGGLLPVSPTAPAGAAVPTGFQEVVAFSGLINPTAVKFASDGRIFVAEKRGVVRVFDSLNDTTPSTVVDLRTNTYNFWDRGLLGLELAPDFPTTPYLYVLYAYDAAIGGAAPRFGTPNTDSDPCPSPPGPTDDGCVVSARLSRIEISGNTAVGDEQVLAEDWCQQYPSHSIGSIAFGADGMLYVTGGDGASFNFADWGQDGTPRNPCGDPPGGPGSALAPPNAEGGALRSQDVRTTGDPTGLGGAVLRLNPNTGAAAAGNPLIGSSDLNARKIVGYGLRNPFRMTIRPGTNEVWVGDVGWNTWEEINRLPNPTDATADNFGWPCYEGSTRQSGYDSANLDICENLYADGTGAVTSPSYAYNHSGTVVPGESCATGSSSVSGIAFNDGAAYPAQYQGGLFFADYSRRCIWFAPAAANGQPNFAQRQNFVTDAVGPVNLEFSPAGELYYPDLDGGTIRRIRYVGTTPVTCPNGEFRGEFFNNTTLTGSPVLTRCETTVDHDWGTASPGAGVTADNFSARWTGNFSFPAGNHRFTATADDGIRVYVDDVLVIDGWVAQAVTTYTGDRTLTAGNHEVRVEFFDGTTEAIARASWAPATNAAPTATINTPAATSRWVVGQNIEFSGTGETADGNDLPASAQQWSLLLQHCPSNCHTHPIQNWSGVATGSFVAPDHEYPSYLELRLTVTDPANGQSATVTRRVDPRTVNLTFQSSPPGLELTVGSTAGTAPFTREVIVGSNNSVSASSPQPLSSKTYTFTSWSDGGAASHNVLAESTAATYTATYEAPTESETLTVVGRFNFQPANAPKVKHYTVDSGLPYATRNGMTYGWTPDNRPNTMDRNSSLSADQRYDTFAYMQRNGDYAWNLKVPNGRYRVQFAMGDASNTASIFKLRVEGRLAANMKPTSSTRWVTATTTVDVNDGKLTVRSFAGAENNKLNWVVVHRVT